mmetsp:Transcript_43577/g.68126  ORF Transcript_43577/g.68126 Transcript_43577/m.68126 type:complete len:147 (+) Transcript_43577:82-522(+)
MPRYTLFIGGLSMGCDPRDIEDDLKKYGHCFFDNKGQFAFAEYEDERDAEDAKAAMDGKSYGDCRISVQWGKGSGRAGGGGGGGGYGGGGMMGGYGGGGMYGGGGGAGMYGGGGGMYGGGRGGMMGGAPQAMGYAAMARGGPPPPR